MLIRSCQPITVSGVKLNHRRVRAECLAHVIILGTGTPASILRRYCTYFNGARPHQGIGQQVPDGPATNANADRPIVAIPVLGGPHHEYRRTA
jgi:hypothetical protein